MADHREFSNVSRIKVTFTDCEFAVSGKEVICRQKFEYTDLKAIMAGKNYIKVINYAVGVARFKDGDVRNVKLAKRIALHKAQRSAYKYVYRIMTEFYKKLVYHQEQFAKSIDHINKIIYNETLDIQDLANRK